MAITLIFPLANADSIPDWIKNTAGWWATDKISETEFVNAIEFLVNVGIIQVSSSQSTENTQGVPDWIKNTAGWWATDKISETEFVNAIEFLVNVGIIQTESDNSCVEDISKFFKDKQKIIDACEEYGTNIIELVPYKNNVEYNNKGFRGENFSNEKVSNVYRIFMVGGSTMIGSTTNDTTIPSILQRMFDSSELEFEVEVINSGFSGGNTISELALIKSELVSYNPNLIIMYDGWNDLLADYPVIGTIDKWQRVCSIAYENKFDVIIALQPIAGFGNKILTQQEKINSLTGEDHNGFQLLQAKSTYEYVARELQNLDHNTKLSLGEGVCETYDLRNAFDNVKGSIYWDQGHTLETGNLIIAEKIFNISMKKLDSEFKNDFKFTELISKYNSKSIINFLLDKLNVKEKFIEYDIKDSEFLYESKIGFKKGKYFLLKSEHQNVSDILVGSDLRDVDLSRLDLNNQDLTGANLSGQDLRDVDLSSTIIRGANFSNTNLEDKNLSGMDIRGINFSNANMKNVDLRDAIISKPIQLAGYCTDKDPFLDKIKNSDCSKIVADNEEIRTNFNNANLQNTKFGNTNFEITQSLYFIDFSNSDLTNSDMSNAQFIGSEFNNAVLDNVTLDGIFVIQTNFINVQMENFNILNSWFQSVSFNEANMTNGNLDGSTLVDVEFIDTDLYNTMIGENLSVGNNNFNCKNNDICDK